MKIPVALIIFNRPHNTKKLYESLSFYKPETLFIISDGPRENSKNDKENILQSRKIFEKINWKCEVLFNNSDSNLGCRERIITGLNWVFSKVDQVIILEDDCIPSMEFFIFMEKMLDRYKLNKEIGSVCGSNFLSIWDQTKDSYLYSKYCNSWGWGTWKDRWQKINSSLDDLEKIKKEKFLKSYLGSYRAYLYWHFLLHKVYKKKIDSWAYIWNFTNFINKNLHVTPKYNLISNYGIGEDSHHTKTYPVPYTPADKIKNKQDLSFLSPKVVISNYDFDKEVESKIFSKSIFNRILWFVKKLLIWKK